MKIVQMHVTLSQYMRQIVYRMILHQLAYLALCAFIIILLLNKQSGEAFIVGGIAHSGPNGLLARSLFQYASVHHAKQFISSFLTRTVLKLFFSILILKGMIQYTHLNLLWMFTGYISAIIAFGKAGVRVCRH